MKKDTHKGVFTFGFFTAKINQLQSSLAAKQVALMRLLPLSAKRRQSLLPVGENRGEIG